MLTTDASPFGVEAVLAHETPEGEKPIGFASRTLNSAERNYSQTEKEGLAVIFGVLKFHRYLYGQPHFKIITDHKPLIGLFQKGSAMQKIAAGRITRWSVHLNQFNHELIYRPGKSIENADTLSRFPVDEAPAMETINMIETEFLVNALNETPLSFEEIRESSTKDPILIEVRKFVTTKWPKKVSKALQPYHAKQTELSCYQETILWGKRVVIPHSLRDKALEVLHECHPGIVKMKQLARGSIYWPGIDRHIEEKANSCQACLMNASDPAKLTPHPWMRTEKPWQRLHADFAEFFLGPISSLSSTHTRNGWIYMNSRD